MTPPTATSPSSVGSQPSQQMEALKQALRELPSLNLQEPILSATPYKRTLNPLKARQPKQPGEFIGYIQARQPKQPGEFIGYIQASLFFQGVKTLIQVLNTIDRRLTSLLTFSPGKAGWRIRTLVPGQAV